MRNAKMTIWVMVMGVCLYAVPTFGTVYFNDGGTYYIDYVVGDEIFVDYGVPDAGTTVNLLDGGRTGSGWGNLQSYGVSKISISGGWVGSWLIVYDNSNVNISGGSSIVSQGIIAHNSSQVDISGGWIGGYVGSQVYDNSQVNISGETTIRGGLFVFDNSRVNISGGTMEPDTNRGLYVYDNSQVNISGGHMGPCSKDICINGGVVSIYGSDFAVNGIPIAYGEYYYSDFSGAVIRLTGTLASGETFNNTCYVDGKLVLVPSSTYTLTMGVEPNDIGIDTLTPTVGDHNCAGSFNINAEKFINCPDVYTFDHWDGDVADPNSATTTVFMDSDKSVTGVFVDARQCGDECHPYPSGDINKDCKVNFLDIAMVANSWLECTRPECD